MDYKEVLGYVAAILTFVNYMPYLRGIYKGNIKPHALTWLAFSVLGGVGCVAQIYGGAGAGAWATGLTSIICFIIFISALAKGSVRFTVFDWMALIASFIAIILWWATSDPLIAVILISAADLLGFLPTFRKTYHRPYEESGLYYSLSAVRWFIAVLALRSLNLITATYPVSLILTCCAFLCFMYIRRKQVFK